MQDPYPVVPFTGPAHGTVTLPGSKSITNRALILAALGRGTCRLEGALFSRDSELMLEGLKSLGFAVEANVPAKTITIAGAEGSIPRNSAEIDVGNAGTVARFLTALLSLNPDGNYRLDGDEAMRRRPIASLTQALSSQGSCFRYQGTPGFFPFTMETSGLPGGVIEIDAKESSQFVSALLMASPYARSETRIHAPGVRPQYVEITRSMMESFGVAATSQEDGDWKVPQGVYHAEGNRYQIEPDVSAASYFMALPLVTGGEVELPGLSENVIQGDAAFAKVVEALGVSISKDEGKWVIRAPNAQRSGIQEDFNRFSDTFLTLAAIAPLFSSNTRIEGIGHTRFQETDRIAAMANELRKLGCEVTAEESAIEIHPNLAETRSRVSGGGIEIDTYEDHRIAMSFAILGCADLRKNGQPWLRIHDPLCCRKTFPDFFEQLESLRKQSLSHQT